MAWAAAGSYGNCHNNSHPLLENPRPQPRTVGDVDRSRFPGTFGPRREPYQGRKAPPSLEIGTVPGLQRGPKRLKYGVYQVANDVSRVAQMIAARVRVGPPFFPIC